MESVRETDVKMFIQSKISYIRQWTRQFLKIYYIQYNVFNNNEHNILHMVSETLISSVIQLKIRYTANEITESQS